LEGLLSLKKIERFNTAAPFLFDENRFENAVPEVELKDISCRLKPDLNAVRLSEKGDFY